MYEDNLPSKSLIFEYWKDRHIGLVRLLDWGEPSCWACGFHYGTKYDIKRPDASWAEILRCWDRIPLQRCHIVARGLGGSDKTSNLFLLCRECHDQMPNTPIPEIFFEWARAQSWNSRENAKIRDAMNAFGIQEIDLPDFEKLLDSVEFRLWWSDKIGLHRSQSNHAPMSSRLTPATLIGLAAYYRRTIGVLPATCDDIAPKRH